MPQRRLTQALRLSWPLARSLPNQRAVPDPGHRGPLGSLLAVVNAKFDTGIPPTADQYEIVLVKA
jgi:hypothetical protein